MVKIFIRVIAGAYLFLGIAFASHAEAMDCAHAVSEIKTIICGDREIKEKDEELRWTIDRLSDNGEGKQGISSAQKNWENQVRDSCQDRSCLMAVYSDRLQALFSDHELYLFYKEVKSIPKADIAAVNGERISDFYASKYAKSNYCKSEAISSSRPVFQGFKARVLKVRENRSAGLCERLASYVRKNMQCVLDIQPAISWMSERSGSFLDSPALSIIPKLPGSAIDARISTKGGATFITYFVDIDNDRNIDVARKHRFFLSGEEKDGLCIAWGGSEDYECLRDEGGGYLEAPRLIMPISLEGKNYLLAYSTVDKEVYAGNGRFYNVHARRFFELLSVRRGQDGRLRKDAVCHFDLVEGDKK